MTKTNYFEQLPDMPAPLEKSVFRTVRFNEIDPMGIMWHGHYASFIEDARVALGDSTLIIWHLCIMPKRMKLKPGCSFRKRHG